MELHHHGAVDRAPINPAGLHDYLNPRLIDESPEPEL